MPIWHGDTRRHAPPKGWTWVGNDPLWATEADAVVWVLRRKEVAA